MNRLAPPPAMLENPHAQATSSSFSENTEADGEPETGNTCNALSGKIRTKGRAPVPVNYTVTPHPVISRSHPPSVSRRCVLGRVPHLQFLGGESRGRSVPGGSQLQPGLPPGPQHAAAQPEPAATQPAGHTPGPAAETAQQVRRVECRGGSLDLFETLACSRLPLDKVSHPEP